MMKCPYCHGKTMVKETFPDIQTARNTPRAVKRFVGRIQWPGAIVARKRRCLNEKCLKRYDSLEVSLEELEAMFDHIEAMALTKEAS